MKEKILIADDDKDFAITLRERLQAEGYVVVEVAEGVRAVEAAHKEQPDLILLDLKMPVGGGESVLQRLRGRYDTADIPIIIITGHSAPGLAERVIAEGASDFIEKPYDGADLLRRIRELMSDTIV